MVETNQPEAIAIISVFSAISTFFIALRVWSRVIAWKEDRTWDSLIVWSKSILPLYCVGSYFHVRDLQLGFRL
jgi:hypothetical protein